MKIHVTYYKYESKLATIISLFKNFILGISVWLPICFIPAFICLACDVEGATVGAVFGGMGLFAIITYLLFCFFVDETKINDKYILKKNSKLALKVDPVETSKITNEIEEQNQNRRDAFYERLLQIPSDFAFKNGYIEEYKQNKLEIGFSIRSHLKVYETMYGQFYNTKNQSDKEIMFLLEEFAFAIGIYYLFGLNIIFSSIRTGDIIEIINRYVPEQFNIQMSLLDSSKLQFIDKDKLIEIINKNLNETNKNQRIC